MSQNSEPALINVQDTGVDLQAGRNSLCENGTFYNLILLQIVSLHHDA